MARFGWILLVVIAAALYLATAVYFSQLARAIGPGPIRENYRLTAWAVLAVVFLLHWRRENYVRGSAPLVTAWRVGLAPALAVFVFTLLIVRGVIGAPRAPRAGMTSAVFIWPLVAGLPAALLALLLGAVFRVRRA